MSEVKPWPKVAGTPDRPRPPIKRPCDYGLECAVAALEVQLGTIEAYNRLVTAASFLLARIDDGDARPQNPLYAVDVKGA